MHSVESDHASQIPVTATGPSSDHIDTFEHAAGPAAVESGGNEATILAPSDDAKIGGIPNIVLILGALLAAALAWMLRRTLRNRH